MAAPKITINIGANTSKLQKDLKKADGVMTKFAKGASTALTGLGVAAGAAAIKIGVDGVKSAIEDEKAAALLAKQLKSTTKATDAQVKATERYITKAQFATGVNDNDLRVSLGKLVRATGSVSKAQKLQSLALDVSAGSGKDLQTVTMALVKAQNGNLGAISKLGIKLDENTLKTKDFDKAQQVLAATFNGAAATAADTTSGKMEILKQKFGEAEEKVGFLLLDGLKPLIDWATSKEGGKVLNDVFNTFGQVIKDTLVHLPEIISSLKTLAKVAGTIDFKITDPKILAAAAAFKWMPGNVTTKAIAALAAYGAADAVQGTEGSRDTANKIKDPTARNSAIGITYGVGALQQLNPALNNKTSTGFFDLVMRTIFGQRVINENKNSGARPYGSNKNGTTINLTVNGAIDPYGTAKTIKKSLKDADNKINGKSVGQK